MDIVIVVASFVVIVSLVVAANTFAMMEEAKFKATVERAKKKPVRWF